MGRTGDPETLVFNLKQTPGNYPKEDNLNTRWNVEQLLWNQYSLQSHNIIGLSYAKNEIQ
jgi:hypothetical protein